MLPHVSEFCSFLRLHNIPLYICDNSVIHSPVDGHLGHSRLLAIVNSAALSICAQIPESLLSVLLCTHPAVELLDHMVTLCLIF